MELDAVYAKTKPGVTPGRYVMLAVSDTGIGMDAETQARLFEPFFTTKEPGKGTGLVLATVHGIVNQSGGHIWVYSAVGRGTSFKIYLPAAAKALEPVQELPAVPSSQGAETILLVEDNDSVRAVARRALAMSGYVVLEASSGEAAETVALSHPGKIHLILTDLVMTGIDGFEIARRLRAVRPDVKVILMSGYTDRAVDPADLRGARYVQKPFKAAELAQAVRKALDS